jgi:hypothetical protein
VEKKEKMQMTTQVRLQLTLNTKERVTHKKNLGIKPITSAQVKRKASVIFFIRNGGSAPQRLQGKSDLQYLFIWTATTVMPIQHTSYFS